MRGGRSSSNSMADQGADRSLDLALGDLFDGAVAEAGARIDVDERYGHWLDASVDRARFGRPASRPGRRPLAWSRGISPVAPGLLALATVVVAAYAILPGRSSTIETVVDAPPAVAADVSQGDDPTEPAADSATRSVIEVSVPESDDGDPSTLGNNIAPSTSVTETTSSDDGLTETTPSSITSTTATEPTTTASSTGSPSTSASSTSSTTEPMSIKPSPTTTVSPTITVSTSTTVSTATTVSTSTTVSSTTTVETTYPQSETILVVVQALSLKGRIVPGADLVSDDEVAPVPVEYEPGDGFLVAAVCQSLLIEAPTGFAFIDGSKPYRTITTEFCPPQDGHDGPILMTHRVVQID